MRRSRLIVASLYIASIFLGVASAWLWLTRVGIAGVDAGAWRVNLLAGSQNADAYTRARVALGAVLALDRSETLYYTTQHDDRGKALRAECRYKIEGSPPTARWWSITAYGADNFLFPNAERRYSVGTESAQLDATGRFSLMIGPLPASEVGNRTWIPTAGTGGMRLTLRLYNPAPAVQQAPGSLAAPSITLAGECP
ncbi:MAG: DUF1214 domain-containing protein [Gammaproteobacteria bacterium]|nr:DUF1214 domain-containing protein [Gammaproteobacteria bacterium]